MDRVQIIGVPQSIYVRTVRIAAEEMNVPYDVVPARPHAPEMAALHPLGKVPAMRHGDVLLCESRAIISYFERMFDGPKLTPADPLQACIVEQWTSLLTTSFISDMAGEYMIAYMFPQTADGAPDRARVEAALPKLEAFLAIMEAEAGKTGFIGADRFSIADAYLIPVLHYLQQLPESAAILTASPGLSSYIARHSNRPSVVATIPAEITAEDLAQGRG